LISQFEPDYTRLVKAAQNIDTGYIPLYEHLICVEIISAVIEKDITSLFFGNQKDVNEYFYYYSEFFKKMGYDTVSFETCIPRTMPGSGAITNEADGAIKTRADFNAYPWDETVDNFFKAYNKYYKGLTNSMPAGMKAIGGIGMSVFECAEDLVGYENLCYIAMDDPKLYADIFVKMGDINFEAWQRLLKEYGDTYCVCRIADDLGYKSSTLLSKEDVKKHILPQYKRIIDLIHSHKKPVLYHSCGCLFDVMDDIIAIGIDAKHSNEDQIAPFPVWVEKYGDKIGNFGGIDTDAVCRLDKAEMTEYIEAVLNKCTGHGGFAFSSGNSIPNYVPLQNYLNMIEIVRNYRGK